MCLLMSVISIINIYVVRYNSLFGLKSPIQLYFYLDSNTT